MSTYLKNNDDEDFDRVELVSLNPNQYSAFNSLRYSYSACQGVLITYTLSRWFTGTSKV